MVVGGVAYHSYSLLAHASSAVGGELVALTLLGALGGIGAAGAIMGSGGSGGGARDRDEEDAEGRRSEDAALGAAAAVGILAAGSGADETESHEDGSGSGRGHHSSGHKSASLSSAKVKHVKFKAEATAVGDRSSTWISPWHEMVDRVSLTLPVFLNRFSPLAARVVNDGAYARAMIGSTALVLPFLGIVLGIVAAISAHTYAVPPSFVIMLAALVLSIVDALAGFLAALIFTASVLVTGHLDSATAVRTVLGIDVTLFAVGLAASAARPLRRAPAKTKADWYDRFADCALAALIGMWAADKMISALPAISGISFPLASRAGILAGAVGAVIVVRYILETVAAHLYPLRLKAVAPPKIGFPSPLQQICSAALKTAVFVFFAIAYLGNAWELYVGTALFFIPSLVAAFQTRLPNVPTLVRFLPAGLIKLVLMLLVAKLLAALLAHQTTSAAEFIALAFVVLSLPGVILSLVSFFAREGETFGLNWAYRIGGIGVAALGVLIVQGVITIG